MATYTTQTRVRKNSGETDVGTRRRVNFIEGANVTLNIVDDGTDGEIDVEIVAAGAGSGDVTGPGASTDNAIARFHETTGKVIQDYTSNPPTVSDTGDVNIDGDLDVENILVADDAILKLGAEGDQALLNRSTTLTADTALANVLIGTPDTTALAANSLIISNITTDGDILIAVNDGGASKQMLFLDGSTGITHIGKPGTPGFATATGDTYIAGKLEVDGDVAFHHEGELAAAQGMVFGRNVRIGSDAYGYRLGAGQDVGIYYSASDPDAKCMLFYVDESADAGNNVPVFLFGEHTGLYTVNLGLFDTVVDPKIALFNVAADAYVTLDSGDDAEATNKGLYFKAQADEDIEILNLSVTGTPRIFWDESDDDFNLSHGLDITGNIVVSGTVDGVDIATRDHAKYTDAEAVTAVNAAGVLFAENFGFTLDAALSADQKWSGIVEAGTAGATLDFGDVVYHDVTAGEWLLAKADVTATSGAVKVGINVTVAQVADGSAMTVLLWGKVRSDADYAFTVDAPVFISAATAGDLTSTAPTGTTNFVVRIVGYGNTADELFFCPDNSYVELA